MSTWRRRDRATDLAQTHRPVARRSGPQQSPQGAAVTLKQTYDWSAWPDLTIRLGNLHNKTTTLDLWRSFQMHGNIELIRIYENSNGDRDGNGIIKFSPPPPEAFWTRYSDSNGYMIKTDGDGSGYNIRIRLEQKRQNQSFKIQSPINPRKFYDPQMKMNPISLRFGVMTEAQSMMAMEQIKATPTDGISFVVDLRHKRITISFVVNFQDPRTKGDSTYLSDVPISLWARKNKFKFEIPFSLLEKIDRVNSQDDAFSLIISLPNPPEFYRRRESQEESHSSESLTWSDFDTWYRQTDIVYDPYRLTNATISTLHKDTPVIDIGRWTTYNFEFSNHHHDGGRVYKELTEALEDFNINVEMRDGLRMVPRRKPELWALIDHPTLQTSGAQLQQLNSNDKSAFLPFEVRYQLEVCLSRDVLSEFNITAEFVARLADMASTGGLKAQHILEYIAERGTRVYEPMSIFEDDRALTYSPKTEIPHYCAYTRKATVTPTTVYFSTPTVETTNRVLRKYAKENAEGRFLRVQFTEEMSRGKLNSCANKQRNDDLFTRVYRTLYNGIRIGDRLFELVAFGNSQFRENGALFFCPTEHISCNDIRQWMGDFGHIKVVAKYAARLGQCFSTTRAINSLAQPDIVTIPDVERNLYCFTDGVGKISPFLAQMITVELGLKVATAPSAFQFRLGGCKGILVVSPDAKGKEVHIRKSQQKFTSVYNGLEVIRWSRFSSATLNRQTITIMSSLGVPDEVFLRMLTEQLTNYQRAMTDDVLAQNLLCKYVDNNQMTISIASMINSGFMTQREPFVLSLLHLWRSWSIKLLKEKAKIIVEDGAFLLGCVDETGSLRGYIHSKVGPGEAVVREDLPQIFVQIPSKNDPNAYNVIEGICLVGRNPSLHPGDLRVVEATNVPALHHLRDVIVFPQTGERDVPSMCSGGDLDGDDYFVIWDKALQPPEWNCAPMNYTAQEPTPKRTPVEVVDIMKFFVNYIKNDALPTIATSHLAQSDSLPLGVKDARCLELAALHSKAVDYMKTGLPAEMPKRLKAQKWPHFMEKSHLPNSSTYNSYKILGQLYDKVESVSFIPQWQEPFDARILEAYELDDAMLKLVRQTKSKYDTAMLRIMAQQDIQTEFEVWSTFVLSKPRVGSDYKIHEEIGNLSDALKDRFRHVCIEHAGGKDFSVLGPFVAGMYKVTKEELDLALIECQQTKLVGGRLVPKRNLVPKSMPLISFPWLFEKELARIATGFQTGGMDSLPFQPPNASDTVKSRKQASNGTLIEFDDYVQQVDGVVIHRGEELDLFGCDTVSDDASSNSDSEDALLEEHSLTMGKSEVILNTGIDDVVPRMFMDGVVDPQRSSQAMNTLKTGLESLEVAPSSAGMSLAGAGSAIAKSQDVTVETEVVKARVTESALEKLASLMDL